MSARVIARQGAREAWLEPRDGQVYVTPNGSGPKLPSGIPSNVRWECSIEHWERYFDTVKAAEGWEPEVPDSRKS